MRSLERISILLSLINKMREQGSWCGETHIQKAAYILQVLTGVPTEYEFVLYKHGPYSFELHGELGSILADGLVKLEVQPAPYGPSWTLTEAGQTLRARFVSQIQGYAEAVSFLAEELRNKGVAELERLGTAFWVKEHNGRESREDTARAIVSLKPHVDPNDALVAVYGVEELVRNWQEVAPSSQI